MPKDLEVTPAPEIPSEAATVAREAVRLSRSPESLARIRLLLGLDDRSLQLLADHIPKQNPPGESLTNVDGTQLTSDQVYEAASAFAILSNALLRGLVPPEDLLSAIGRRADLGTAQLIQSRKRQVASILIKSLPTIGPKLRRVEVEGSLLPTAVGVQLTVDLRVVEGEPADFESVTVGSAPDGFAFVPVVICRIALDEPAAGGGDAVVFQFPRELLATFMADARVQLNLIAALLDKGAQDG